MKSLFDKVSMKCSKMTTKSYSTSFSLGILLLHKKLRDPIYAIYGFVRFADEIVDSFEGYDKNTLLKRFWQDTDHALTEKISLNPILNSFQEVVHKYHIEYELIETFLKSMEMDLHKQSYNKENYDTYILGSAEVVGLMCLRVFVNGDEQEYQKLKPSAMKLGAAFQKVNFLRDLKDDYYTLGRTYFPNIDLQVFDRTAKMQIIQEIEQDFRDALPGIKALNPSSKSGVYLSYVYYQDLLKKLKKAPAEQVLNERMRISNRRKVFVMMNSLAQIKMNLI